uniref:hypothetical protein n=1 Tax=Alloprevotella sp. TaxID=1872471 RepID=UPI004029ADDE
RQYQTGFPLHEYYKIILNTYLPLLNFASCPFKTQKINETPYPIIRIFALTRHVLVGLQQQHKKRS